MSDAASKPARAVVDELGHAIGVARAIDEAGRLTAYDDPARMVLTLRCALAHAEAWLHEHQQRKRSERSVRR